jgi:hypothetical protein
MSIRALREISDQLLSPRAQEAHAVRAALSGAACLAFLAACGGGTTPEPAASSGSEVTPAAPRAETGIAPAPDLAAHMQVSFWESVRARDALIAGDLVTAQHAADTLAQLDYTHLVPADWKPWVQRIQQYARELSMAPSLPSAAQELGKIALVCGECHDVHHRGPNRVQVQPEPWRDPPEDFDARMLRHQIGAAQIWDGLVQPSEQAFRSGTITLTRAPLTPPMRDGEAIPPAVNARIEEVRGLARQARAATSYEERGRVYGELVARCASCHLYSRPAP